MDDYQYRRALDALLSNLMQKRSPAAQGLVDYIKAHQTDKALEHVGDDLRLMGDLIDQYIEKNDPTALTRLTAALDKYAADAQADGQLITFVDTFFKSLHPAKARRVMDGY